MIQKRRRISKKKLKKQKKRRKYKNKSSKYIGVSKKVVTSKTPWQATICIDGKHQYLGCYETEIEAAKCVNFVCKKYDMELKNPELSDEEENFTWPLPKKTSSKYVGVSKKNVTAKKPWQATMRIDGKRQYLGCYKTEIEAAKCVNFVCKKESMKIKNPELSNEETKTFTWPLSKKTSSKYVGVGIKYETAQKPWHARLCIDGKRQYLGSFKTEIEAAKFVNFVCKKESMKIKNPELSDEETETFTWPLPPKKKSSKYVCVNAIQDETAKKPWHATMWIDGKQQHLGYFKSEIKAAKFVNFVCKKESMKIKNPELSDEETETFTWPLQLGVLK